MNSTEQRIADLERTLRRALQFAERASDWNFDAAEIDDEEVSTSNFIEELEAVLE